jgi:transposase InsO family protein
VRKHRARRPDRIWVGDVTYISMAGHWRYLAVVMDQYSRRILGWSLARARNTRLTRAAFDYAMRRRRPVGRLVFHSDRGSEYAGHAYGDRLRACGIRQSMTGGGSPSENAHMESFFHSLKADVVHGRRFSEDRELRTCIKRYVSYYNHRRMHSSLGYQAPVAFESKAA